MDLSYVIFIHLLWQLKPIYDFYCFQGGVACVGRTWWPNTKSFALQKMDQIKFLDYFLDQTFCANF